MKLCCLLGASAYPIKNLLEESDIPKMVGKGEFRERFNIFSSILSFSIRLENPKEEKWKQLCGEKGKKVRRKNEENKFFAIEKTEN